MATDLMDTLVKGAALTGERCQGQRGDHIGKLGSIQGIIQMQSAHAGHGAGTVGDAQTLLAGQGIQDRNA